MHTLYISTAMTYFKTLFDKVLNKSEISVTFLQMSLQMNDTLKVAWTIYQTQWLKS